MPADGYILEQLESLERKIAYAKEKLQEFRIALEAFSDGIKKVNPDMNTQISELHKMIDARDTLLDKLLKAGKAYNAAVQELLTKKKRS